MSISPAREDESPCWEQQTVQVLDRVSFATKRGLVQTGDTPEALAATMFPKSKRVRVDKGRGPIKGADNAERVVAKRDGALFALGPSRVEVFALEPVQVELAGMNPQRIPKGTRITIRSPSRIESIRVLPLHPILTDTEYINLQRQRNTENAGILKVPLKKVTLTMVEDQRGALCHCGKRFSRNGLILHLEEPFGLPTGALQYKPPTPAECDVVFVDASTEWGTAQRIWTQEASDAWTGTLTFSPSFEPRTVFMSCTRGLRITPNVVTAEPNKTVTLTAEVTRAEAPFQIIANCIVFVLFCTDSTNNRRMSPMHSLRLPNLRYKSMKDPNTKSHPLFVAGPSRQVRPVLELGRSFCVYKTDPLFEELRGEAMVLSDQEWKLFRYGKRVIQKALV